MNHLSFFLLFLGVLCIVPPSAQAKGNVSVSLEIKIGVEVSRSTAQDQGYVLALERDVKERVVKGASRRSDIGSMVAKK